MSTLSLPAELTRLVGDARAGNPQAVARLVAAHDGWLRSVAFAVTTRADLTDDIVQQVWLRAWRSLPTLEDPSRLRAWLGQIARRTALDVAQARRTEERRLLPLPADDAQADRSLSDHPPSRAGGRLATAPRAVSPEGPSRADDDSPLASPRGDPQQRIAQAELRTAVMEAVRGLPAAYREPFVLRHLEQWPYGQIAEVLGITPAAVEARVGRARRMLLDEMTRRGWP